MGVDTDIGTPQQVLLIELGRWLGHATQYSPHHPSCVKAAERILELLTRVLETEAPLTFGILRDQVMAGGTPVANPVVRARIAAHLHERGVIVLRFVQGVTADDLTGFAEVALLPVQTVFDRGGLSRLIVERGITRIQVEELAHDISDEQLEAGQRRRRLRDLFAEALRNVLARRELDLAFPEHLAELLDHPDIAVSILEDMGAGLAEAAAGLALVTQQEEERTGEPLAPKLRAIFAALAPLCRSQVLLGLPPLVGEFRAALAWAMAGYRDDELARFCFPAVRTRARELELVLYALSVMRPHTGNRLSTMRLMGLMLHDLPPDDPAAEDALAALAAPVDECDSYHRERVCLAEPAARALAARSLASLAVGDEPPPGDPAPPDGRGAIRELTKALAQSRQFDRFCRRLPDAAGALTADGAGAGVLELVRALVEVEQPEWRELATATAEQLAMSQAGLFLADLDRSAGSWSGDEFDDVVANVRTIVARAPRPALDHLELCRNPELRQILIDLLPLAGERLLPLLRAKLTATAPESVVELFALLPQLGGQADDLVDVARHGRERVRAAVVEALGTLPPSPRATEVAVRYLTDSSSLVREKARGLVRRGPLSTSAIAGVSRLLADSEQPKEVHRLLVEALGDSKLDLAAQQLFQLLQPRALVETTFALEIRELAAGALKRCPAPGARGLFTQGLESQTRRIRRVCERAKGEGR
jgi:hypothetical protein